MTRRPVATWPVAVLALPAFVAIWSGWVGLGELTGFGEVHPLPGTPLAGWTLNTAITLPIGVETYAAYALRVWLGAHPDLRDSLAVRFARTSAVASLVLGAAGQVAYHLMRAAGITRAPWWITTAVACLPVAVLGMGAALAHLMRAADTALASEVAGLRTALDDATTAAHAARTDTDRALTELAAVRAHADTVQADLDAARTAISSSARPDRAADRALDRAPRTRRARPDRTPRTHAPETADDLRVRRTVRGQWVARTAAGRRTPNAAVARLLGIEPGPARALVSRWRTEHDRATRTPEAAAE